MKTCAVPACSRVYYAQGYCKPHFGRLQKYGNALATPIRERPPSWQRPGRPRKGTDDTRWGKVAAGLAQASVARLVALGACPRCKGAAEYESDMWGPHMVCLMCGHEWSMKA